MLPGIMSTGGFSGTPPSVTLVHTSSSASEVASYGSDEPGRWIVVLALGGDTTINYFVNATISGVPGTPIIRHSSGDGVSVATATSIITGQPSGSSGTVSTTATSGTPVRRFYVLKVMGYDLSSAVFSADSTPLGVPPWSTNVPSGGLTLSVTQSSASVGAHTWTNLTERIADNVLIGTKINSAAWDLNMVANPALSVDVTASDVQGSTSAVIATFNPSP